MKTPPRVTTACSSLTPTQTDCHFRPTRGCDSLLRLFFWYFWGKAGLLNGYNFGGVADSLLAEGREGCPSTNLNSALPVSIISHGPDFTVSQGEKMVVLIRHLLHPVAICALPFKGYTSLTFPSFTPMTYFPENSLTIGYWWTWPFLLSVQM